MHFKFIVLPWNMCTNPSAFEPFPQKGVLCASFFCAIGQRVITMICSENHHTKNNQYIPKVKFIIAKIRGNPIVFLLSIKSYLSVVQEKITITCKLTNYIITANQTEQLPSLLSRQPQPARSRNLNCSIMSSACVIFCPVYLFTWRNSEQTVIEATTVGKPLPLGPTVQVIHRRK